ARRSSPRLRNRPFTITRPLVKVTSSRTCVRRSHPARPRAGVMNFVQISRSLSDFLSLVSIRPALPYPFLSCRSNPFLTFNGRLYFCLSQRSREKFVVNNQSSLSDTDYSRSQAYPVSPSARESGSN